MKYVTLQFNPRRMLLIVLGVVVSTSSMKAGAQSVPTAVPLTKAEKALVANFNKSITQYLKEREGVKKNLAPLSKDSTPEQITAYQKSFVDALRARRAYAQPGYILTPAVADYLRAVIKTEFTGSDRIALRQTVLEADTAGVPMLVNYPYPETKELTQIPPKLLLRLPELPKEVKYRFVGSNLLLVDTDNGLIIDFIKKALP